MSGAFFGGLLFFSVGLFVFDVFSGGLLFFPVSLFMSSNFFDGSFW